MSRQTWKATERALAARLGGQRIPVSGRARGEAPDIAHPLLSLEVKHRKSLPAWLHEAMAQAVACAGPDQLPVAILHEHGRRHDADLCILRLADLQRPIEGGAKYSKPAPNLPHFAPQPNRSVTKPAQKPHQSCRN